MTRASIGDLHQWENIWGWDQWCVKNKWWAFTKTNLNGLFKTHSHTFTVCLFGVLRCFISQIHYYMTWNMYSPQGSVRVHYLYFHVLYTCMSTSLSSSSLMLHLLALHLLTCKHHIPICSSQYQRRHIWGVEMGNICCVCLWSLYTCTNDVSLFLLWQSNLSFCSIESVYS